MRCRTMARQVRRVVYVAAWLWVAPAALGCGSLPVVTSKVDPVPFQEQDLEFLEPGSTDLETLSAELGPALIVRKDGKLLVYGAAVNRKRVLLVGPGSPFEDHYLVVELDGHDTVERFEVVRPRHRPVVGSAPLPCTSWGVCILRDPWQYEPSFFGPGQEDLPAGDDVAVVLDTPDADSLAKEFLAGADECAVYLFNG